MLPYRITETGSAPQPSIVDTISDYYRFLTRLPHVDPDNLVFPSSEGWQVNEDELRARGRTEEAIEVLRRLPYLRNNGLPHGIKNNITNNSLSIAYCNGELEPAYVHQQQPTPGHVIWLAIQANKEGHYLLLDIEARSITEWNPIYPGPPLPDSRNEDDLEEQDRWMNYATLPIADYFEKCKRRYEKLLWIPVPGLRLSNSKGTAYHFERIMTRGFQDDYLYSDEEYGDDSSSSDVSEDEDDAISAEEVDQLMEDAAPDGQRSVEGDLSDQAEPSTAQKFANRVESRNVKEDEYDTDVAYEDVSPDMKRIWQDTKATYMIYKESGWPAIDYDRAGCMRKLQGWLEQR